MSVNEMLNSVVFGTFYWMKLIKNSLSDNVMGPFKGSLTLAMGKCLWFSVKIKVYQPSLSSP